jgi:hypothetical protein
VEHVCEEVLSKGIEKNDNGWKDYNSDKRNTKTILLNKVSATEEDRILTTDAN